MLRRPVKQERQYSYTDIDVESAGDFSSASYGTSSSTIAFKLTGLLKKQWQSFTDTNFAICQESTEFVVEHKPTFDKEKLKLIQMSTFIENDITCGTVTAIKRRSQYDGPLLNDLTFSPDWNADARKINEMISELNRQIERENLLLGSGRRLSLSSLTSCFSGGTSSSRDADNGGGGNAMRPMPIEVSRETVTAFARNPRLFLQSPLHLALLGVLCFALIGLLVTLSLVFAAFSLWLFLVNVALLALYQVYIHREATLQRLEEVSRDVRRVCGLALHEATRLVSELNEKAGESFPSGATSRVSEGHTGAVAGSTAESSTA